MKKLLLVLSLFVSLFITGCNGWVDMNIKASYDPDEDLTKYKKFSIIYMDKDNPLQEKELLYMVKKKLIDKGYTYDEQNPDFTVAMYYYCGLFEYYVPPRITYIPHYEPGTTTYTSGYVGNTYYSGYTQTEGKYVDKPVVTGGYTASSYYRNIKLYFADPKRSTTEKVTLIWQGEADSSGSEGDITKIAPYLLDELLGEFPKKTNKNSKRTVEIKETPEQ